MTFLAVHSPNSRTSFSSQLFIFYDQSSNVYKIWTMTQTRKEEILDGFDIFLLYKNKKLLMVQKSLWNNIPFLSFLRHENTKNIPLFKRKKQFFSFCVLSSYVTQWRRHVAHFIPWGGGRVMLLWTHWAHCDHFFFQNIPPKTRPNRCNPRGNSRIIERIL
jgi:hypothetical protein